jgi:tetratricopeptide (TPR) repeat protein
MAYTAVGKFNLAIASLDKAATEFPENEKRANILYRAGFIGWEYLKDKDIASKYYKQFLEEYPNDPRVAEVNRILNGGMLNMTNEQIIEMFKARNK